MHIYMYILCISKNNVFHKNLTYPEISRSTQNHELKRIAIALLRLQPLKVTA